MHIKEVRALQVVTGKFAKVNLVKDNFCWIIDLVESGSKSKSCCYGEGCLPCYTISPLWSSDSRIVPLSWIRNVAFASILHRKGTNRDNDFLFECCLGRS